MRNGSNGSNGKGSPKRAVPWNKGKRGQAVGAGGEESPWKNNGDHAANAGRRPGDRNKETLDRGFTLRELRDAIAAREVELGVGLQQIFDRLRVAAVAGDVKAANTYLGYRIGRPKETIELEGPLGAAITAGGFRCFLGDGRPVPAGPLPLPGRPTPRS